MAVVNRISGLTEEVLERRDRARQRRSQWRVGVLQAVTGLTLVGILLLIGTILFKGVPAINWSFLSSDPVEGMTQGGIWPMIRGSLLLMGGTFLLVIPVGVLGGVYLAEYARDGRFTRLIRSCVTSLAGTPSIIYGLFGLAIFVLLLGFKVSLLSGWATLSLFAIPVIILSTETAVRAVPDSLKEAGQALGLTRWQTVRRIVLPNALPGIVTGIVLSTSRAAGEAPPILLTAGIYYTTEKFIWSTDVAMKPVANLPYHLAEGYRQGGTIPEPIIWGTCVVLMGLILAINLVSILARARARARQVQ